MSNKKNTAMTKQSEHQVAQPQIRFPEFKGSQPWTTELGGDAFDQINNKDHNSDLPVLAVTQEHGAVPRDMIDYHVSVADSSIEGYKVVEVGDFIISLRSFQGGIEFSTYRGICSPAYVILRLKNGHSKEYFRHYLKTDRFIRQLTKNLEGLRDGKMISYKQFSELHLAIPSHREQQRIADCLSSLDELITAEGKKLDALKAHKKGLMQQLFPRESGTVPRLRFPEFLGAGDWKMKKISALLTKVVNPVDVSGDAIYREIGIRSHGRGLFHKEPVSGKALGEKRVFWVKEDAFAVNIVFAWEQAVAVTSAAERGMIASHRFPMYVAQKNKSDVEFIKYFFLTKKGKELLGIASPGGAGRNKTLGQKDFEKLEFLSPEYVEEQVAIARFLSSLDDIIAAQDKKIDHLRTHKRGLMQRLFPVIDEMHA
ncbi:restriction endonuclease subunit S [Alcaligenes sp. RM2]